MKPVVKVIQTAKNEKQAWRKLDDLELFKYYNFRMNTVSVDSSISYQKLLEGLLRKQQLILGLMQMKNQRMKS